MEAELLEVIKKNLPEQTAGELRKYIEEAQRDKAENERLRKELDEIRAEVDRLQKMADKFKSNIEFENELKKREDQVNENFRQLKVERAEMKAAEAERRGNDIFQLVSILVQNPRAIELINQNRSVPVMDQYGSISYQNQHEHGERERKEVKQG